MTRMKKLIAGSVFALALAVGIGYGANVVNAAAAADCCCKGQQCDCKDCCKGSCPR